MPAIPLSRAPRAPRANERGVALILVLLIVALLYIVLAELVTRSQFDAMTSENYEVEARIREGMRLALRDVLQDLADAGEESAASEAGGAGDLGGALGGMGGAGDAGGAGGGEEEATPAGDSSRASWFEPSSYFDDNQITVYAYVVDENRKFNLLSLVAEDEEFAERSRDRLVRLFDMLWDGTRADIGRGDAELWANTIREWIRGRERNDDRPRIPLTSNEDGNERTLPLDLDELKMLPKIPSEVWEDRILGELILPGLRSVLTVHTSLSAPGAATPSEGGESAAPADAGGGQAVPNPEAAQPSENQDPESDPVLGAGIRVNVNTAPPAVLRCLETIYDLPRNIIDELLRHRNEVDEEAETQAAAERQDSQSDFGSVESPKLKIFESVDSLEDIEVWRNFPQNEAKERFKAMLTTSSHVFTVHLAGVYKRDESGRSYLVTRMRGVFVRLQDGDKTILQPLIPMRQVDSLRLFQRDFPEEAEQENFDEYGEFAAEERLWNPFFLEFYDPEKRNRER